MRTENPTFEQCGDSVHARHGNMGRVTRCGGDSLPMHISVIGQSGVATPSIGVYLAAGGHCVANERYQISPECVRNMAHPHPSKTSGLLYLYGDQNYAFIGTSAPFPALLDTSDQCFINFHFTRQPFTFGTHHCNSVTLQHIVQATR